MFREIFHFITGCFKSGEGRSQKLKRNVVWSSVIKVSQMAVELFKVPLLLTYLSPEKYGVWITIVSILMWTQQFDLGLGSGLRYKLTESIARNDTARGKGLVSTAYMSMTAIMSAVFLVMIPVCKYADWNSFLNVRSISHEELSYTVLFVLLVFVFQFIFSLVSVVLKADQRAAISDVFKPLGSILSLGLIFVLKAFSSDSLFLASLAMSLPYVIVLAIANIYFYLRDYHDIFPSIRWFDKKYLKDIYNLGLKYFVNQFSALIVFSTSSILISNIIRPEEAAVYNIANTYFNLPIIFYGMILVPFSAAITDAYVKNDYAWIKNIMHKLKYVALLFSAVSFLMLVVSPLAFHIWVGDKLTVPVSLSIVMFLYTVLNVFVSPYNNFLGGVGKLNVCVCTSVFKIIAFLPVSIWAVSNYGTVGMVLSIIAVNTMINLIFGLIQYNKIINRRATGIWNK